MPNNSFFYGQTPSPEANVVDSLIDSLEAKVQSADESKSAAAISAGQAASAAANAATSESNVAGLADQAQDTLDQANVAIAEANEASAAAAAAVAGTATNATNAANSATAAASSATAAAGSASAADTSATNAATSASSVSSAAATATTQASNASASASAAAGSASTATTQATNAANSATSASTSATNAASSATAAAGSASTATTQATAAASSASSAATQASNAASSASTASTQATAAASSATAAAASYDSFDDRYLGAKASDPSLDNDGNALLTGALYFSTASNLMKVYTGSSWQNAASSVNGTAARFRYIATAAQTSFSGSDSNGLTLAYDAGFIDVYLNGSRLDQTDYTATSGSTVVLASAASASDELNIVAYGNFSLANTYTITQTDAAFAKLGVAQAFTKAQRGSPVALTSSSASIASDFSLANNFTHTFTENTTLANPTNLTAGQSGTITLTQHASSPKTLAFGSYWKFPGGTVPAVTAANSAVDVIAYYVESSTRITAKLLGDSK